MGTGYKFIAQCVFSFSQRPSGFFFYDDSRGSSRRRIQSTGSNDNELYIKRPKNHGGNQIDFSKPLLTVFPLSLS
jgi:hypothetical protein